VATLGREAVVAIQAPEPRNGERRVLVCFDGDEVAEGRTHDLDLDRPQFMLRVENRSDSRAAIVPLASVKRIVVEGTLPRQDAPLIDLLSEIRGLRGLRHRGQISAVEYERRRSQVLNRI
jgi:hypothetical protein